MVAAAPAVISPSRSRHSPCIGVCQIDEKTGYCLGCARTRGELGDWMTMTEAQRDSVWAAIPARLESLSVRTRLLPWTPAEIAQWVADGIANGSGTWVTGVPGAVAEFPCGNGRQIDVHVEGEALIARAPDAVLRLRIGPKLRAFTAGESGPVVLGLPRGRAAMPVNSTVEALGADTDAVDTLHRQHQLFDFGVGRVSSRFCIRTDDKELIALMFANSGKHWSEVMPTAGMKILSVGPNRVVESAAARIEVFAPIPLPGGDSPDGAHTHFLPAYLASGEEIAKGLALPDFALPAAVFYPKNAS